MVVSVATCSVTDIVDANRLYLIFQSLLVYIGMSYANYAASAYAGNTLARSVIAAAFPLFGSALFTKLHVGPGSSLLGGISLVMIIPLYVSDAAI